MAPDLEQHRQRLRRFGEWTPLPLAARIALLLFCVLAVAVDTVSYAASATPAPAADAAASVALTTAVALFAWRPPFAALAVLVTAALSLAVGGVGEELIAATLSTGLVVVTCSGALIVAHLTAITAWIGAVMIARPDDLQPDGAALLLAGGVVASLIGAAFRRADRRSRALRRQIDEQLRAQEEQLQRERDRIADELHDIVAHGITLVALHARVLRRSDEEKIVEESLRAVEDGAQQALIDIRRMLRVVAGTPDGDAALEIAPPLRDALEQIAADLRAAGFETRVDFDAGGGLSRTIETMLAHTAREAATNVLKHAGGSPSVVIRCTGDADTVLLEVVNARPPHDHLPWAPPSGYGLARSAERARLLGGEFTAAPDRDGWRAAIRLPRR